MKAQEFLKSARKQLGFTLSGLAQASGYGVCDIKNYEYGRAKVPGDLVLQIQAMLIAKGKQPSNRRKIDRRKAEEKPSAQGEVLNAGKMSESYLPSSGG